MGPHNDGHGLVLRLRVAKESANYDLQRVLARITQVKRRNVAAQLTAANHDKTHVKAHEGNGGRAGSTCMLDWN